MVNALWVFTLATIPQTFQSMCVFGWSNKAIIIIIIMEKRTKIFIFIKKRRRLGFCELPNMWLWTKGHRKGKKSFFTYMNKRLACLIMKRFIVLSMTCDFWMAVPFFSETQHYSLSDLIYGHRICMKIIFTKKNPLIFNISSH